MRYRLNQRGTPKVIERIHIWRTAVRLSITKFRSTVCINIRILVWISHRNEFTVLITRRTASYAGQIFGYQISNEPSCFIDAISFVVYFAILEPNSFSSFTISCQQSFCQGLFMILFIMNLNPSYEETPIGIQLYMNRTKEVQNMTTQQNSKKYARRKISDLLTAADVLFICASTKCLKC